MDKQLLDILVCPVSGLSVTIADSAQIEALNSQIDNGTARFVDGAAVTEHMQAVLITRDKRIGYQVKDGIPIMLPERGIELSEAP
ncbi:MAG: Trm112 family protein [Salinisphaera sp.]|jgi:uncharacterized protein YbaR (Trm112 family)|nr:Trm112 family protein [Salinisphaera sp.]